MKQCLSALKHWDPDIDVFIDCLDLRRYDAWKRQLEYQIPTKDTFLLFWSVNAMKSKWVAWEIDVAEARRGLEDILADVLSYARTFRAAAREVEALALRRPLSRRASAG